MGLFLTLERTCEALSRSKEKRTKTRQKESSCFFERKKRKADRENETKSNRIGKEAGIDVQGGERKRVVGEKEIKEII